MNTKYGKRDYPAGKVELGINGFDKHRPVYFISVAPQDPATTLTISDVYPQYEISNDEGRRIYLPRLVRTFVNGSSRKACRPEIIYHRARESKRSSCDRRFQKNAISLIK